MASVLVISGTHFAGAEGNLFKSAGSSVGSYEAIAVSAISGCLDLPAGYLDLGLRRPDYRGNTHFKWWY